MIRNASVGLLLAGLLFFHLLAMLEKRPRLGSTAGSQEAEIYPIQGVSHVALSLALGKGLPVIGLSERVESEMLYFAEDRGFATGADAISRLLESLLSAADDLMDLFERDLKLGIKVHCLSGILASKRPRDCDERVHGAELQPLEGGEA